VDCSRAIHDQHLKKVVIPLKIVAVFEPSENCCRSSEESGHSSEKNKWFVTKKTSPPVKVPKAALTGQGLPGQIVSQAFTIARESRMANVKAFGKSFTSFKNLANGDCLSKASSNAALKSQIRYRTCVPRWFDTLNLFKTLRSV
jgi:hypothetical protein